MDQRGSHCPCSLPSELTAKPTVLGIVLVFEVLASLAFYSFTTVTHSHSHSEHFAFTALLLWKIEVVHTFFIHSPLTSVATNFLSCSLSQEIVCVSVSSHTEMSRPRFVDSLCVHSFSRSFFLLCARQAWDNLCVSACVTEVTCFCVHLQLRYLSLAHASCLTHRLVFVASALCPAWDVVESFFLQCSQVGHFALDISKALRVRGRAWTFFRMRVCDLHTSCLCLCRVWYILFLSLESFSHMTSCFAVPLCWQFNAFTLSRVMYCSLSQLHLALC